MSFEKDVKTEIVLEGSVLTLHVEMDLEPRGINKKTKHFITNPNFKMHYVWEAEKWLTAQGYKIKTRIQGRKTRIRNISEEERKATWVFELEKEKPVKKVVAEKQPEKKVTRKRKTKKKAEEV
tara:strand:- start:205 stop:573 length:369 start_codon:yes stop_codon:yes gene_type:complete